MSPGVRRREPLVAYCFGTLAGLIPLGPEWLAGSGPPSLPNLAGFGAVGGLCAVLAAALGASGSERVTVPRRSLWLVALVVGLEQAFWVNVAFLPQSRLFEAPSLLWTAASVSLGLIAVWGVARLVASSRGHVVAVAVVLAIATTLGLHRAWPPKQPSVGGTGDGPNLLLIVMDAVRRDHVGLYGADPARTLRLNALEPEARIYEKAYSTSSFTRQSVPTILGARDEPARTRVILEMLHEAGYVSACFSDNPILESGSEVSDGFAVIQGTTPASLRFAQAVFEGTFIGEFVLRWPILARMWDDHILVDRVIGWASRTDGPYFLYIHLMDAHQPYDEGAIDGRTWRSRELLTLAPGDDLSQIEIEDVRAHYAGGVHSADRAVGRILDAAAGWGRPYLAVVTADHGESLGEAGLWRHGNDLSWPEVAVPLLIVGAETDPARVGEPVGHASIMSTLLAAAGIDCADCPAGDLRRWSGGMSFEGELRPDKLYRVADGYRVIVDNGTGVVELYDLAQDPRELRDLAGERRELSRELAASLANRALPELSPEDIQRFRALGYIE